MKGIALLSIVVCVFLISQPICAQSAPASVPPSPEAETLPSVAPDWLAVGENVGTYDYALDSLSAVQPSQGWIEPWQVATFVTTYYNAGGAGNLAVVEFMVNNWPSPFNCVTLRYNVQTGRMYIHHALEDRWVPAAGVAPGEARTVNNGYGILHLLQCRVVMGANQITVTWAVEFNARMSGKLFNLYTRSQDMSGHSTGWADQGNWAVNRAPNWLIPPDLRNTAILSGQPYWFNPRYRDVDGQNNLDVLHFFIGDQAPVVGQPMPDGVWIKYSRMSNQIWLWDSRYSFWVGPQTPQTSFRMTNQYVTVRGPGTRIILSDYQTLCLDLYLEFKPAFAGRHRIYMRAEDILTGQYGGDTGWRWKGWIEIQ